MVMIRDYIALTKPGIIVGNLITACAGFFMATKGVFVISTFFALIFGLSLIIGSSCVLNNYHDRFIDAQMERTKNRALVTSSISTKKALLFSMILLFAGSLILWMFTNPACLYAGLVGCIMYVLVYTPLKLRTKHGTLIGSISGACPPVVGYLAFTGAIDLVSILLFLMITFWQMPHFYAIAMYRMQDYKAAGIPVLTVVSTTLATKMQMITYTALFGMTSLLPYYLGMKGLVYASVSLSLSLSWLLIALKGLKSTNDYSWAKLMFRMSLIVVMILSVSLSIY
jgi:heme o synthase